MKQEQRIVRRLGNILAERIGVVVLVLAGVVIVVSIAGYFLEWKWTGLYSEKGGPKTLWDWLELLIVPMVLAAGALWFKKVDEDTRLVREKAEADSAAYIEEQRAQETTLEAYFDRMSELLLDKDDLLLESNPGSACQEMASVWTLTVLRRLDEKRRSQVFEFLRNTRLLGVKKKSVASEEAEELKTSMDESDPIAVFAGRNMRNMDLQNAILDGADLCGANLIRARLDDARLREVHLEGANLMYANLESVDLWSAKLEEATIYGAFLEKAFLNKANLRGADLRMARLRKASLVEATIDDADLAGADLREVVGLNKSQVHTTNNWELAFYSPPLVKEFELPDEHNKHVKEVLIKNHGARFFQDFDFPE